MIRTRSGQLFTRRVPIAVGAWLLVGASAWLAWPKSTNEVATQSTAASADSSSSTRLTSAASSLLALPSGQAQAKSSDSTRDLLSPDDVRSAAFAALLVRIGQTSLINDQRELLNRLFEADEDDLNTFTSEGLVAKATRAQSYLDFREYLFSMSTMLTDLRLMESEINAQRRTEFATAYLMAAEAIVRNPNLSLNDASEALQRIWTDLLGLQQQLHNRLISDLTLELIRASPGDRLSGNRDVWLRYRLDLIAASGDLVEFNRAVDEWASLDLDQRSSLQGWRLRARVTILTQNAPLDAVQRQSGTLWSGLNGLSDQQIIDIGSEWINADSRFMGDRQEVYRTIARAFLPAIEQQIARRQSQNGAGSSALVAFRDEIQQRLSRY